jgi:hypothetical protein
MEEFVDKFKGLYQSSAENNSYFDSGFFKKVEQLMQSINYSNKSTVTVLDKPIQPCELAKAIGNLAFGQDLIINEMLKSSSSVMEKLILKLFNMCLNDSIYPTEWCKGFIVPILKSGNSADPTNDRPVTISSCLGKLLSSILNKRLDDFLTENNVIPECQIGFQKGNRTSDHVLLLKAIIDAYKYPR